MAERGVVSSIFLQGKKRAFVDKLRDEDAEAIYQILLKGGYHQALKRNHLSYLDAEKGKQYAEDLRVAEGRISRVLTATAKEGAAGSELSSTSGK